MITISGKLKKKGFVLWGFKTTQPVIFTSSLHQKPLVFFQLIYDNGETVRQCHYVLFAQCISYLHYSSDLYYLEQVGLDFLLNT